jgi:hypothetical protein
MFNLYKDASGQWRWRLVTSNGKTIADGAEGYRRRGGAVAGIASVKKLVAEAGIVEVVKDGADG